jgi:hypothetical protein
MYLSLIKDSIQLYRDIGSPNLWQKPSSWFLETRSKAPFISINRQEDFSPLFLADWISCVRTNAASIADLALLPPICLGNSKSVVSAR